jgi:hypothetical protein
MRPRYRGNTTSLCPTRRRERHRRLLPEAEVEPNWARCRTAPRYFRSRASAARAQAGAEKGTRGDDRRRPRREDAHRELVLRFTKTYPIKLMRRQVKHYLLSVRRDVHPKLIATPDGKMFWATDERRSNKIKHDSYLRSSAANAFFRF